MRAIPTLKISISGVRGVVGQSLTPKLLTRFAQAFGTHTGSGTIVIGRDPRTSGEMVKHAVVAGLLSTGSRVVDIGVCPVPTVQLQVRHRRAQGGIAITASHNPAEWNALKFIGSSGLFLDAGQARELLDIYHQGEYTKVGGAELRTVEAVEGATDLHIKSILDALGPLPKRAKKLRVVIDSCNGAGSLVGPIEDRRYRLAAHLLCDCPPRHDRCVNGRLRPCHLQHHAVKVIRLRLQHTHAGRFVHGVQRHHRGRQAGNFKDAERLVHGKNLLLSKATAGRRANIACILDPSRYLPFPQGKRVLRASRFALSPHYIRRTLNRAPSHG